MVLREFREADAQEINRLAVTAFEEYSRHYSDWPALAAFYERMSDLAKTGGNPEQYPFSLPQAPAEFRIELG
jgi:hypothetical protein